MSSARVRIWKMCELFIHFLGCGGEGEAHLGFGGWRVARVGAENAYSTAKLYLSPHILVI